MKGIWRLRSLRPWGIVLKAGLLVYDWLHFRRNASLEVRRFGTMTADLEARVAYWLTTISQATMKVLWTSI